MVNPPRPLGLLPGCTGFSPPLHGCHRTFVERRYAAAFPCFSVTVYEVSKVLLLEAGRQAVSTSNLTLILAGPLPYPDALSLSTHLHHHSQSPQTSLHPLRPCSWVCPLHTNQSLLAAFWGLSAGCSRFKKAPQGSAICLPVSLYTTPGITSRTAMSAPLQTPRAEYGAWPP